MSENSEELKKVKALVIVFLLVGTNAHQYSQVRHDFSAHYRNRTVLQRQKRAETGCYLFLNEINVDNPQASAGQFIEITKICQNRAESTTVGDTMEGYKLVLIRGSPPSLVFVLDLSSSKMKSTQEGTFFVIGSSGVNVNWKLPLNSATVQSIYDDNKIPVGDDSPYGIALLYATPKSLLRDIKLDKVAGKFAPKALGSIPNFGNVMRKFTKDLIVYGRRCFTNRCYIFEKMMKGPEYINDIDHVSYQGDPYLLRDFDNPVGQDLSLNRCTAELLSFVPDRFRLGRPTPGASNDCSGTSFFLENHLQQLILSPTSTSEVTPVPGCEPDSPGVSAEDYRDLGDQQFFRLVQQEVDRAHEGCSSANNMAFGTAANEVQLTSNLKNIASYGGKPIWPLTLKHEFNPVWIDRCKDDLPFHGQLLRDPGIQSWLEAEQEGTHCRYSCFACKNYFTLGYRADLKKRSQIATTTGYYNKDRSENKKMIEGHAESDLHKEASAFMSRLLAANSQQQLESVIQAQFNQENEDLIEAFNLVKLVWAETASDMSFSKHPVMWKTAKSMGARMGIHHFHEGAPPLVIECISEEMHKNLINYLMTTNQNISLIVDTSHDNTNELYLITYIQALEDQYPHVYLYQLVHLPKGETAQEMYDGIMGQVDEDESNHPGFKNYFKNHLKVFASDGAAAMRGPRNSLSSKLKDFVGGHLPTVWCMGHRTDLSIKAALTKNTDLDFVYFKHFESVLNKFYGFYNSRGSKNWNHLRGIAQELDIDVVRMRYYYSVRWSSSHYGAVKALQKDLKALLIDLTAIGSADSGFAKEAVEKARDLHGLLEDKAFAFMIQEYSDFLYVFKQLSEGLQGKQGLLIAKAALIEETISALRVLKSSPGLHVRTFLSTCSCPIPTTGAPSVSATTSTTAAPVQGCSVTDYFKSAYPKCGGWAFKPSVHSLDFPSLRPRLYDALVDGLLHYFDLDLLRSFDMFNPTTFRPPPSQSASLARNQPPSPSCPVSPAFDTQWRKICNFYFKARSSENTNCLNSLSSWKQVVTAISSNPELMSNTLQTPASFWFLVMRTPGIQLTETIRKVLNLVLITPFSSTDAERGFSIMNNIKRRNRSSMSPKTLAQLLRVKVNGPTDVDLLKVEQYARAFVRKHVRPDEDLGAVGRPQNPLSGKSFGKNSRLF